MGRREEVVIVGKYREAYDSLLACVDTMDDQEEKLKPVGKYYKLRLLRLIHQVAAYTERPTAEEVRKTYSRRSRENQKE